MEQPVYTLLCKRDLEMALVTLPKIVKFLSREQKLIVVDDGSFDDETARKISELSTQIKVIVRKEREDFILSQLSNFPNCKKYREEFPLAFKLLDIPLLSKCESSRFTFTDSDIIYIKNCEGYFEQNVNTYLKTDAIKLSVKLQNALLSYRWKLPLRFNSGYFSYDTSKYDLEFIEYYLGLPNVRDIPWLSEQTCWALLFGRSGPSFCPFENEFVCRENFAAPQTDTHAIHLIGNLKKHVKEWADYLPPTDKLNTKAQFEEARNVTKLDWVKKTVKRFI